MARRTEQRHETDYPRVEHEHDRDMTAREHAKTSAAATFALVFGLSALITAIAVISAPVAIVFGLLALVLGIVGIGKANASWNVTGKGLAIGGLVLGVLGLLLGVAITVGAATFLSDPQNRQDLRDIQQQLPEPSDLNG
jgi:uncharacterized membrane protein